MKRFILPTIAIIISIVLLSAFSASSSDVKGRVIYDGKKDYHIVETEQFYVIVEWYEGVDFSKGDIIEGDLHSYQFKMVRVNNSKTMTRIYIENYWRTKEMCMDWLREHDLIK